MLGAEPDPESHWRLLWDNLPIREELREFNFLEIKKKGIWCCPFINTIHRVELCFQVFMIWNVNCRLELEWKCTS